VLCSIWKRRKSNCRQCGTTPAASGEPT
jgi:hypothetical protein